MSAETILIKRNGNIEYTLKFFIGDNKYVIFKQDVEEMKKDAVMTEEIGTYNSKEQAEEIFNKLIN